MSCSNIDNCVGWIRCTLLAVTFAVLLIVPGCLTDGSIPIGGGPANGMLRGEVVRAEDPDLPLAGAVVTMRSPEGAEARVRCDNQGVFEFSNVPAGLLNVTVDGPEPGIYLPEHVTVQTEYSSFSTIAVALDMARSVQSEVSAVHITPRDVLVSLGGSVQFSAEITGGNPQRKTPTWVVEGAVGSVTPHGEVLAQQVRTGTVRAIVGDVSDSTTITVANP